MVHLVKNFAINTENRFSFVRKFKILVEALVAVVRSDAVVVVEIVGVEIAVVDVNGVVVVVVGVDYGLNEQRARMLDSLHNL